MLRVLPDKNKVVVEGVNRVYKHMKPNRRNPQGGRLSKEMPIDASNVLLYCPQLPARRPRRPCAITGRRLTRSATARSAAPAWGRSASQRRSTRSES